MLSYLLYKFIVCLYLEDVSQIGFYFLKRDSCIRENSTQSHKLISELQNKPYEETLCEIKLLSLEDRRLRGKLIKVF